MSKTEEAAIGLSGVALFIVGIFGLLYLLLGFMGLFLGMAAIGAFLAFAAALHGRSAEGR